MRYLGQRMNDLRSGTQMITLVPRTRGAVRALMPMPVPDPNEVDVDEIMLEPMGAAVDLQVQLPPSVIPFVPNKTCPDGSVVLSINPCPTPPPAPATSSRLPWIIGGVALAYMILK